MSTTVTFNISVSGNDADVQGGGSTSYPPSTYLGAYPSNVYFNTGRIKDLTIYYNRCGLLRFDTSSIPDGATIESSTLDLTVYNSNFSNDNSRNLAIEYYNFDGNAGSKDYTTGTSNTAHTKALSTFAGNTKYNLALSNLNNINKTGYTGFRTTIDGGQPTGDNKIELCSSEHTTPANRPTLTVTYSTGWGHKIFGVTPVKIFGVTPKKVNGIE